MCSVAKAVRRPGERVGLACIDRGPWGSTGDKWYERLAGSEELKAADRVLAGIAIQKAALCGVEVSTPPPMEAEDIEAMGRGESSDDPMQGLVLGMAVFAGFAVGDDHLPMAFGEEEGQLLLQDGVEVAAGKMIGVIEHDIVRTDAVHGANELVAAGTVPCVGYADDEPVGK